MILGFNIRSTNWDSICSYVLLTPPNVISHTSCAHSHSLHGQHRHDAILLERVLMCTSSHTDSTCCDVQELVHETTMTIP